MKSFSIILVLLAMACTLPLCGQEFTTTYTKNNAIKINPIAFASSEFQLTFERYFNNRKSSISIIPSIILKDSQSEYKEAYQGKIQYRFFLSQINKADRNTFLGFSNFGFYAGVYALYIDYEEDYNNGYWDNDVGKYIEDEYHKDITAFEGGAIIGLQIDVTERILIDFTLGGGVRKANVKDTFISSVENPDYIESYGVFDPEYSGVKPSIALNIGFTF